MRDLGSTSRKILLLLEGGLVLSLTGRPDAYFKVIKKISKEWKKINERKLRDTIKRLYRSKLIDYREEKDGSVVLKLSENGKSRILKYNLDGMKIEKPRKWDNVFHSCESYVRRKVKNFCDKINFVLAFVRVNENAFL